jgi:hypothetical protein
MKKKGRTAKQTIRKLRETAVLLGQGARYFILKCSKNAVKRKGATDRFL